MTIEELRATIGARSDKLQLAGCEMASGERHDRGSISYRKRKRRASLCASRRLTGKSYSNGDPSVSYYYDQTSYNGLTINNGKGQRTGMSDGSGQTAWSYDTMGRIVTEKRSIGSLTKTISFSYDLDGSRASITYPSGAVVGYSYGNDRRPVSAVDSANGINYAASATYAAPGGLASVVLGQNGGFGITTSNSYNSRLFPTALSASSSNGTTLSLSYSYFANGNVNVETNGRDSGRSATYTYDSLNRVSTATSQATSGSDCWGQSFGYDRYANLTTINVTQCTATALSLSFNTSNRITNSGFSYDAAGDLTGDGVYTYSWNGEALLSSAASVTYTYDGDLRRVKKSNGTLYWYCAACGQVLAESDLSGNITSEYTYFGDQRIARRDVSSANVYYLFSDRVGSYRTLTDSTGNVQGESDYYPFGGERAISSTVTDSFRFAGMKWDPETGLNHTLYRKFSPNLGRWHTGDPKGGCVNHPQGHNRYAYVAGNPTNFMDPSGDLSVKPRSPVRPIGPEPIRAPKPLPLNPGSAAPAGTGSADPGGTGWGYGWGGGGGAWGAGTESDPSPYPPCSMGDDECPPETPCDPYDSSCTSSWGEWGVWGSAGPPNYPGYALCLAGCTAWVTACFAACNAADLLPPVAIACFGLCSVSYIRCNNACKKNNNIP